MSDVIESSVAVLRGDAGAGGLARRIGVTDVGQVVTAAEAAVPLLVEAIRSRLTGGDGGEQLAEVIGRTDLAGLADPEAAFSSGGFAPSGLRLVDLLFDDAASRGQMAGTVTERSGLPPGTGAEVITATAWVVAAQLREQTGTPVTVEALSAAIEGRERRPLPSVPTTTLAPIVSEPEDIPLYRPARAPMPARAPATSFDPGSRPSPPVAPEPGRVPSLGPEPSSPPIRAAKPGPAPPSASTSRVPAAPTVEERSAPAPAPAPSALESSGAGPSLASRRGAVRPDDDVAVGSSRLVTALAALLALAVAGGALWWLLDGRNGDSETSAELASEGDAEVADDGDTGESPDQDDSTTGEATDDVQDPTDDDGGDDDQVASPADDGASSIDPDQPATIDVAMADPVGRSTATGSAGLRLDPVVGEICYDIRLDGVATPADGHIHLGPAGVKGGIVVDFGPMDNGVTGCQPVPGPEIKAILSDLDSHYVELHDPIDDFTIRAQLSEGVGPDGQPVMSADQAAADQAQSDQAVLFDPDGGGAIAIVESGRIVLRGEVADRQVAERVLVDFAGLSEIIVVDELTVAGGAPLPSGRVIIESPEAGLFASSSDVLDAEAAPLIGQLIALMEARPDWQVTVVGHTDSTGNEVTNLELSLQRAEAVRQELIAGGVASDRIRVRGAGSTDPLADNATVAGRAENRRIEFEIER